MIQNKRHIFVLGLVFATALTPAAKASNRLVPLRNVSNLSADRQSVVLSSDINLKGLNPSVYELAFKAHQKALENKKVASSSILAVVDYSLPSTEKRLWVFDLDKRKVILKDYVAHGRDASGGESLMANYFSNTPNSNASSLGVFMAGKTYRGKHGLSLRLKGLEREFNTNAEKRSIVIHAAPYVSQRFMQQAGRLGCSYGCFSVRPQISGKLIKRLPEGSLLFAYYPDENWMKKSDFITD